MKSTYQRKFVRVSEWLPCVKQDHEGKTVFLDRDFAPISRWLDQLGISLRHIRPKDRRVSAERAQYAVFVDEAELQIRGITPEMLKGENEND